MKARATFYGWGLLIGGLLFVGLLVQVFLPDPFAVHCLFERLFSAPCPTCGLTRACQRLLVLDFSGAIRLQPLVLIVPLFILTAALVLKRGGSSVKGRVLAGVALGLIAVNWVYLIIAYN